MYYLTPTKLSTTVDISQFDRVLNIHSGFIACDMNYFIDVIYRGKKHSILMTNGLRSESPAVYHDNGRIFIIEGGLFLEVKLNDTHDVDGINLPYDLRRAVKMSPGILICHMAGCVMMSNDLQDQLWSIEDARITDVVWREGELRVYYGEHSSILLDPETGVELNTMPAAAVIEDQNYGPSILRFPLRREH